MSRTKTLSLFVSDLDYNLAKHQFILSKYPDAIINAYGEILSKTINSSYNKFNFVEEYRRVYVQPYCELEFSFKDKTELIKIYSKPQKVRLVYINYDYKQMKYTMKFSRLKINMKSNNFKETMLEECKKQIIQFIKKNQWIEMDTKHLDPRLKQLLSFI